jgi:hypothetical protein
MKVEKKKILLYFWLHAGTYYKNLAIWKLLVFFFFFFFFEIWQIGVIFSMEIFYIS